ncbi:MAG: STAS domain-containing protein [Acidobacteria bacterium]|nr:STAS domain-containing protein [Acidobacteriota bacterium]
MSLILNTRKVNGHIVVEASGRLDFGESCLQLRELAKRLTSDGNRQVVLNMQGISYVDSAGIGLLLSVYATIRNQGGDLKLVNVSPRVKELLRITNLLRVFDIFEDESVAIEKHNPTA